MGIARARELEARGITRALLSRLVKEGVVLRQSRGLYVVAHHAPTAEHTLAQVTKRVPEGIFCLLTALRLHGLTTQSPADVWVVLPEKARRPRLDYPRLRIARFSGEASTSPWKRCATSVGSTAEPQAIWRATPGSAGLRASCSHTWTRSHDGKTDLAASVAARLLNRARQTGDDYQTLLTSYCLERFLYRLAVSERRDRFVLKGAMLLRVWSERPYRATLDLDLLRRGDGAFDAIRDDLRAIVATQVPPDAVDFGGERIRMEAIRAEDEYAGTRATLPARSGKARLMLQIDMGQADAIWPAPRVCAFPTLLDFPAPELLA
jgi:hypothetical protein